MWGKSTKKEPLDESFTKDVVQTTTHLKDMRPGKEHKPLVPWTSLIAGYMGYMIPAGDPIGQEPIMDSIPEPAVAAVPEETVTEAPAPKKVRKVSVRGKAKKKRKKITIRPRVEKTIPEPAEALA